MGYGIAVVAVPLILIGSAVAHLLRPSALPAALRAHRTLPAALVIPCAVAVVVAEALLGALSAVRPSAGLPLASILFLVYGLYGVFLLRNRPSVPCGCAGSATSPMTHWTVTRNCVLAAVAVLGVLTPRPDGTAQYAVAVMAGATVAVLLWILPAALHDPSSEVS